jgi:predicted glycosyltransferase
MRIMIDLLHPAHVHFFKHFCGEMQTRGHQILLTARVKDCATDLLTRLNLPHVSLSASGRGLWRQARELCSRTARFVELAGKFRPDVLAGIMGPTIALAGQWLRRPAYVFYDTEFAQFTNRWVYPLATRVITPDCYEGRVGSHHVRYPGYHELAYLHPRRFTPDAEAIRAAGIDPDQPYVVVRFVGWWATHDRGERGLTTAQKLRLVRELSRDARVVISSEQAVPAELEPFVYRGPVEQVHHLLAGASLYYGESATMASESAVLGTPAIYIATTGRGYTNDQARYGLVTNFHDRQFDESVDAACGALREPAAAKARAKAGRVRMLGEKIDVTSYLVDLFEGAFGPAVEAAPEVVP